MIKVVESPAVGLVVASLAVVAVDFAVFDLYVHEALGAAGAGEAALVVVVVLERYRLWR